MEIVRQNIKTYISTWLLALFAFGLLGLLAFSEIFHNTVSDRRNAASFSNPVKSDIIANLKSVRLKNRFGKFTVVLDKNGHWNLAEPKKMPAPAQTMQKLIAGLQALSIHTLHQKEPINLQSFSLDNPTAILDLYTKLDERVQIKIGLVNPVNNTSYITVSNHDIIFQTARLAGQPELLRLSDFVDPNIFGRDLNAIKRFSLFHGKSRNSSNTLTRTSGGWQSKRYRSVSDESVEKTLSNILEVKSRMIVDSQDKKLLNLLGNYLDNPLYRVKIETVDGSEAEYAITRLLGKVSELKIEKRQYFLIKSSARPYPHLIPGDYLKNFKIRYSDLR